MATRHFRIPSPRVSAAGLVLTCLALLLGCSTAAKTQPVRPGGATRARDPGRVLMVLSSASTQPLADTTTRATGTFLGEFWDPYTALTKAGYEVDWATATGAPPAIDPESLREKYWSDPTQLEHAQTFAASSQAFLQPLDLETALQREAQYQGLLVPGGQGVMVDLLEDPRLHTLIERLGASHRAVGLICHAPMLLTRVDSTRAAFTGRTVTSVTGFEEFYIESFVMGAEAQVRGIGSQLEDHQFEVDGAFPGSAHAVRDCNLVTSQNPYSGQAFNHLYLQALLDYRHGARCVAQR